MSRLPKKVSRWLSARAEMIRHSEPGSTLATLVLLAIIVLAPLPYAGVMPRDRAALQVAAFIGLAISMVVKRRLQPLSAIRVPLLALSSLGLLGVAQTLPWPSVVAEVLSPSVHRLWLEAAEIQGLEPPSWTPLSLAPEVTRLTALHLFALAACFMAACLQASERPARRLLTLGLMIGVLFQILYGADKWLTRNPMIWGLEMPGDASRLRGTFVNADHFAFYLGMAVSCASAWLWWGLRRALDTKLEAERRLIQFVIPLATFSFCFAALAFSGSRAGLVAVVGGMAIQGGVLALRYRRWQLVGVGVGLLGLGLAAVWMLGWNRGVGRLVETSAYEITWNARFQVWWESLDLIAWSPVVGTGLGSFRQAFPLVQPPTLPGSWRHAHSDVLELAITAGLPALLLLGWAVFAIADRLWLVLRKGRRSEDRMLALAAFGACGTAILHSLVEFSLTMPANAFTLALLVGVACGTPVLVRQKRDSQTVFLDPAVSAEPRKASTDAGF